MKKYKFTILTGLLVLVLLLMPPSEIQDETQSFFDLIPHFDKIVHMCLFGFMSVVLLAEKKIAKMEKFLINNIIILTFFAVCTEILQKLSGYRSFDIYDILADTIGIVLGTLIFYKLFKSIWRNNEDNNRRNNRSERL